jgi:hypothetical protein
VAGEFLEFGVAIWARKLATVPTPICAQRELRLCNVIVVLLKFSERSLQLLVYYKYQLLYGAIPIRKNMILPASPSIRSGLLYVNIADVSEDEFFELSSH